MKKLPNNFFDDHQSPTEKHGNWSVKKEEEQPYFSHLGEKKSKIENQNTQPPPLTYSSQEASTHNSNFRILTPPFSFSSEPAPPSLSFPSRQSFSDNKGAFSIQPPPASFESFNIPPPPISCLSQPAFPVNESFNINPKTSSFPAPTENSHLSVPPPFPVFPSEQASTNDKSIFNIQPSPPSSDSFNIQPPPAPFLSQPESPDNGILSAQPTPPAFPSHEASVDKYSSYNIPPPVTFPSQQASTDSSYNIPPPPLEFPSHESSVDDSSSYNIPPPPLAFPSRQTSTDTNSSFNIPSQPGATNSFNIPPPPSSFLSLPSINSNCSFQPPLGFLSTDTDKQMPESDQDFVKNRNEEDSTQFSVSENNEVKDHFFQFCKDALEDGNVGYLSVSNGASDGESATVHSQNSMAALPSSNPPDSWSQKSSSMCSASTFLANRNLDFPSLEDNIQPFPSDNIPSQIGKPVSTYPNIIPPPNHMSFPPPSMNDESDGLFAAPFHPPLPQKWTQDHQNPPSVPQAVKDPSANFGESDYMKMKRCLSLSPEGILTTTPDPISSTLSLSAFRSFNLVLNTSPLRGDTPAMIEEALSRLRILESHDPGNLPLRLICKLFSRSIALRQPVADRSVLQDVIEFLRIELLQEDPSSKYLTAYENVTWLLMKGKFEEAIHRCVAEEIWSHALAFSSILGGDTHKQTTSKFVQSLSTMLEPRSPPPPPLSQDPLSSEKEYSQTSLVLDSAVKVGIYVFGANDEKKSTELTLHHIKNTNFETRCWLPILLFLLSLGSPGHTTFTSWLTTTGEFLLMQGPNQDAFGGHLLLLLSGCLPGPLDCPKTKLAVIGVNHGVNLQRVLTDIRCLLLTEILEFSLRVVSRNSQFFFEHFVPPKLLLVELLLEHQREQDALDHLNLLSIILRSKATNTYSLSLREEVRSLLEKLEARNERRNPPVENDLTSIADFPQSASNFVEDKISVAKNLFGSLRSAFVSGGPTKNSFLDEQSNNDFYYDTQSGVWVTGGTSAIKPQPGTIAAVPSMRENGVPTAPPMPPPMAMAPKTNANRPKAGVFEKRYPAYQFNANR